MPPFIKTDTYEIALCRASGERGCRFSLVADKDLAERVELAVCRSGWPEFLAGSSQNRPNRHKRFSISISGCPNGCSRPQIADIGLLWACRPQVSHQDCTQCGLCAAACRETAISGALPVIDYGSCVACGDCEQACPEGAITCERGLRIQVGGKLGRHPRLGTELTGVYSSDEVTGAVTRALHLLMDPDSKARRLGDIFDKLNDEDIRNLFS